MLIIALDVEQIADRKIVLLKVSTVVLREPVMQKAVEPLCDRPVQLHVRRIGFEVDVIRVQTRKQPISKPNLVHLCLATGVVLPYPAEFLENAYGFVCIFARVRKVYDLC